MKLTVGPNLEELKIQLQHQVDKEAETIRGNYITIGAGQSMVYEQKRTEALSYIANPAINPDYIPHLIMEATLDNVTVEYKANEILTMAGMWAVASANIETLRLASKKLIRDSTTVQEARIAAQVNWASLT